MKRLLVLSFLTVMFTVVSMAQGLTPWDGTVATNLGAGEGTAESPYLITDASQMAYMAKQVDDGEKYTGKYFRLKNDLDLGGALATPSKWLPIGGNGKAARSFYGVFDGNNKSIYNIYIDDESKTYMGLFGHVYNTGIVKNLTIASGTIKGKQYVGVIAGFSYGTIENCVNSVDVEAVMGLSYVGGIVGANYGHVTNCYNAGTVKGQSGVGGITSSLKKTSISPTSIIENCFNIGNIHCSGISSNAGGIVSEMTKDVTISNCYNMGSLILTNGEVNSKIGGIVGKADGGNVSQCYNVGTIQYDVKANIGGLFGTKSTLLVVENCYYDKQMCGVESAIGNAEDMENTKGLLTKDMIKAAGISGFSSESWVFTENLYPRLKYYENNKIANLYSIPAVLSSTSETRYDTRFTVKASFTVSTALSSTWNIEQGTSVTINQSIATVIRPDNGDDNVKLKVTTSGISRILDLTVYQKPVTVTIVQPENGTITVMDGDIELVSPAAVESNSIITLIATPGDEYMLDTFIVNGENIEGDKVTITGNTTLSARFAIVAPPGAWDGTIATEFGGGSGKEIAPYLIKSANQLAYLAQQVNNENDYKGSYFKLVYNLDMGEHNNWTPIGKFIDDEQLTVFGGHFDGNGKEIRNLYINNTELKDVGLFGYTKLGSTIKNLGVDANSVIINLNELGNTGAIVGSSASEVTNCYNKGDVSGTNIAGGIIGNSKTNVINSYNEGKVTSTSDNAGGIIGSSMMANFTNCYNTGEVTGNKSSGGIIGHGNASVVSISYNTGKIQSTTGAVGGIAGSMGGSVRVSRIERCVNFGEVSTPAEIAGGIVGKVSNGTVSNCYNAGNVSAKSHVGGVTGRYNGMQGSISGCYNIGHVSSMINDPFIGGVLGYIDGGGFSNCYFDKQIITLDKAIGNAPDSETRKGVVTSFLTVDSAIDGFNADYWIFENGLYPHLKTFSELNYALLFASPATLHAIDDSNYESVKAVRTNFNANTENGVLWSVEEGTTITINNNNATVTPQPNANDNVIVKATLGQLSKTITLTVPKLAYKLTIDNSVNGTVVATNAVNEPIESGSEIAPGAIITLTPNAVEGYHFVKWWDDETQNPRTVTVNGNLTVSATFAINTYTLTANAGENGEITPEGVTTVEFGANQTYTIMPNEGYTTEKLLIDNVETDIINNYTFNHIVANHTISAVFKIKSYSITATTGENGTITPAGVTSVDHGISQTYNILPNEGYKIAKLTVDGATVPTASSYTFNSVVSSHTIEVTFEKQTFTITASADENGEISPNGEIEVEINSDKDFIIIPNDGFIIKDVVVDGVSALKDVVNSKYSFKAIKANHMLHATFQKPDGVASINDSNINVWSYAKNIYCKADTAGELDLEIIDITGKVVLKQVFTSTTEVTISTNGLYVVRIIENNVIKSTTKVAIK